MISLFDMFKVGIGPSSSHTVGPMKAGKQFVDDLVEKGLLNAVTRVAVDVYGSLSLTGKGHHTDIAIIMGLAGNQPDTVDIDAIPAFIRDVEARGRLLLANGQHEVDSAGQKWNPEIHSSTKSKTQDGLWRRRKSTATPVVPMPPAAPAVVAEVPLPPVAPAPAIPMPMPSLT